MSPLVQPRVFYQLKCLWEEKPETGGVSNWHLMPVYRLTVRSEQFKLSPHAVRSPFGAHHRRLAELIYIIPIFFAPWLHKLWSLECRSNIWIALKIRTIFLLYGLIIAPWLHDSVIRGQSLGKSLIRVVYGRAPKPV